jgi:HD-GYP domain-containing protein (c-di-GMP phosphodiesterase class II)
VHPPILVRESDGKSAAYGASPISVAHEEASARQADDELLTRVLARVREGSSPPEEGLRGPLPPALYRLARQMNHLSRLEEILEQVAEASLEMFPLANFFAISVPDGSPGEGLRPLIVRTRQDDSPRELHLSQSLIRRVIRDREAILYARNPDQHDEVQASILMAQITSCLLAPLYGQRKLVGVLQVDSRGRGGMFTEQDLHLFTALASSVAFAIERAELTASIYTMFEGFVSASISAIEARDPTTAGHSQRVADYTVLTASMLNEVSSGSLARVKFQPHELTELRYAALLHDFGKIGVREVVLQKPARLHHAAHSLVLQRIETLKAIRHREIVNRGYAQIIREGRSAYPGEIEALQRAYMLECSRLDRYRAVLAEVQQPRPLSAEQREVIQEMARIRYLDSDGNYQSLLAEEDRENLLIDAGSLNEREREHIKTHAALTRRWLSCIPWSEEFQRIPIIAGLHHEKLNGQGYPLGLGAEAIPPSVRVLTICDIFDALTAADRPYKRARSADFAVDVLCQEVEQGALDADLVRFFVVAAVPEIATRYLGGG